MVTLHILQLLDDAGFGTIDSMVDGLFFEKLPIDASGVAIYSRGGSLQKGKRNIQSFDLWARGSSDLLGADKLEKIKEYFDSHYQICELPTTEYSNKIYTNATIATTSNVENIGADLNDRVVFRLSAQIIYDK